MGYNKSQQYKNYETISSENTFEYNCIYDPVRQGQF